MQVIHQEFLAQGSPPRSTSISRVRPTFSSSAAASGTNSETSSPLTRSRMSPGSRKLPLPGITCSTTSNPVWSGKASR